MVVAPLQVRQPRWRLVGATLALAIAFVIVADVPALAAKSSASVTLSGGASGKSAGGTLTCIQSTQLKGPQLSLSLGSFAVGAQRYSLSASLAGSNYAAGTYDLSEPTGTGVFLQLAADAGGGRWYSTAKSGTITLAKDKKSGSFEGDLTPPNGGPPVHVKGTFKCGKVQKVVPGATNTTTLTTKAGTEQILYDGTSKLLSTDPGSCHSVTDFTLTIRNGAKYAGKTAVVMFFGLDYPSKPTKSIAVGPDGSIPVTFEAFSCSRGGAGEQQGVALVSVDGNTNVLPPPSVVAGS
jgi:hypothetical protein